MKDFAWIGTNCPSLILHLSSCIADPLFRCGFAALRFQAGAHSFGRTDEKGRFGLHYGWNSMRAEIGTHRIEITTYRSGNPDADPPVKARKETLSAKYNVNLELSRTVEADGENEFTFN